MYDIEEVMKVCVQNFDSETGFRQTLKLDILKCPLQYLGICDKRFLKIIQKFCAGDCEAELDCIKFFSVLVRCYGDSVKIIFNSETVTSSFDLGQFIKIILRKKQTTT